MDEDDSSKHLERLIDDEFFDQRVLEEILKGVKNRRKREVVELLYEKERRDYELLQSLAPGYKPKFNRLKLWLYILMYKLFGVNFVVKHMERGEKDIIRDYEILTMKERDRKKKSKLRRLIRSTKRYEYLLRDWIKEERLKYMGFVALGMTDSIVSIIGTEAGFLGATANPLLIGLSALIVGIATGVSMGAGVYLQVKEEENDVNPVRAALAAAFTYLVLSLLLTLPYFLLRNPYIGFGIALLLSFLALGFFTYYTAVVKGQDYYKKLGETLGVVLLASVLSYGLGYLADHLLNIPLSSL